MHYNTTIKIVLQDSPSIFLPHVKVSLFDRDTFSRDDMIGTAVTDENGEARFQYTSEQYVDVDERMGTEFPDLYAVVYDAEDQVVMNTRPEVVPNTPRKSLMIPIARDLAVRHKLIAE